MARVILSPLSLQCGRPTQQKTALPTRYGPSPSLWAGREAEGATDPARGPSENTITAVKQIQGNSSRSERGSEGPCPDSMEPRCLPTRAGTHLCRTSLCEVIPRVATVLKSGKSRARAAAGEAGPGFWRQPRTNNPKCGPLDSTVMSGQELRLCQGLSWPHARETWVEFTCGDRPGLTSKLDMWPPAYTPHGLRRVRCP